jgi:hypothetical protein
MTEITPKTMSVPEAGRIYYGVGRDASYQAAKTGQIIVIEVGKYKRVPIAAMDKKMEQAGQK